MILREGDSVHIVSGMDKGKEGVIQMFSDDGTDIWVLLLEERIVRIYRKEELMNESAETSSKSHPSAPMTHETKEDWLQRVPLFDRILYWIGCLKLVEKQATFGGKYSYGAYPRRIHPITWLFILVMLVVSGINLKTLRAIKADTVWF